MFFEDDDDDAMEFGELTHQEMVIKPKAWMKDTKMSLVTSIDMLREVVKECIEAGHYGWDTETTGLDTRVFDGRTVEKIVGHCLAPHEDIGYYVPLRHEEGSQHNLSISEANEVLTELALSEAVAVFHNNIYDGEMLAFGESSPVGEWDDHRTFEDTLYMSYLSNSRKKTHGLKEMSQDLLGRDMIELKDLYPPDHKGDLNFAKLDPSEDGPVWYGCSDAMCTLGNYKKLRPLIFSKGEGGGPPLKGIYGIEKMCSVGVRWMQRARLPLDLAKVAELIVSGQDDFVKSLSNLYEEVNKTIGRDVRPEYVRYLESVYPKERETIRITNDYLKSIRKRTKAKDPLEPDGKTIIKFEKDGQTYPRIYDVMSAPQLGPMLQELGIKMPSTETGKISTKSSDLEAVIEKHGEKYGWMRSIKKFREVNKAVSNFLLPMEMHSDKRDSSLSIQFKQHGTDTGRFATPGRKEKRGLFGGTTMNLQSLPSKDKKDKVECMKRIRECIKARPGKIIVAIDFSGVELRLVTNLSREPKWIKAFFECSTCGMQYPNTAPTEGPNKGLAPKPPAYCHKCGSDRIGDLHTLSGIAFFGEDAPNKKDWKEKRGIAKGTNFALLYGGSGNTVAQNTGLEKNEGWRIFKTFNSTYTGIKKWQENQVKLARRLGYVRTPFGRRYPTPDINHEEKWIREKNERNAINSPIQGASADVTKLAMGLCYKKVKEKGWLGKVNMLITIHDELVFEIDEDIFEDAVTLLDWCMTSNPIIAGVKWPVCLPTDAEFGRDWTVPYDRKDWVFQRVEELEKWPEWAINLFSEKSIDPVILEKLRAEGKGPYKFGGGNSDPSSSDSGESNSEPETGESNSEPKQSKPAQSKSLNVSTKADANEMPIGDGKIFEYKMSRPLTFGAIEDLSSVIHRSKNRGGTRILRVVLPNGDVLMDESAGIVVNAPKFLTYADELLEGC